MRWDGRKRVWVRERESMCVLLYMREREREWVSACERERVSEWVRVRVRLMTCVKNVSFFQRLFRQFFIETCVFSRPVNKTVKIMLKKNWLRFRRFITEGLFWVLNTHLDECDWGRYVWASLPRLFRYQEIPMVHTRLRLKILTSWWHCCISVE